MVVGLCQLTSDLKGVRKLRVDALNAKNRADTFATRNAECATHSPQPADTHTRTGPRGGPPGGGAGGKAAACERGAERCLLLLAMGHARLQEQLEALKAEMAQMRMQHASALQQLEREHARGLEGMSRCDHGQAMQRFKARHAMRPRPPPPAPARPGPRLHACTPTGQGGVGFLGTPAAAFLSFLGALRRALLVSMLSMLSCCRSGWSMWATRC